MIDKDIANLIGEDAAVRLAAAPLRDLYRRDILLDAELTEEQILRVQSALSIGRRLMVAEEEFAYEGQHLMSPDDVAAYMRPRLMHLKHEELHVILLNNRGYLEGSRMVSKGSINATTCRPREIFGLAMREAAASIVMVHNHPSGDPSPSHEDLEVTQKALVVAGASGIKLHDHVVIAGGRFFSLNREGLM